jgi:hypothetical protein
LFYLGKEIKAFFLYCREKMQGEENHQEHPHAGIS